MNFEKFCWLVEKSLLRHTRLDQFEDPFEGAVTYLYAKMRDSGNANPDFGPMDWDSMTYKFARVLRFASCWHASEYESDAQWKLYASGGAGIAILSTQERLKCSVDLRPHTGILADMAYLDFDNSPMRRPVGHRGILQPGYLKRKCFDHEKEVRGIIVVDPIIEGGRFIKDEASLEEQKRLQPPFVDAPVDLKGMIQAIVISPLAKPFQRELVDIVAERHGLKHLVKTSELLRNPVF